MDLNHFLSYAATLVTFGFAAAVLNRFRMGRRPHSLMWGIGLVLYGLGTLSEAVLALRWSPVLLRVWYLSGAMLTAAWLGQGTVYLLIRKPLAFLAQAGAVEPRTGQPLHRRRRPLAGQGLKPRQDL